MRIEKRDRPGAPFLSIFLSGLCVVETSASGKERGREGGGVPKGERRRMRHENATGICKEKRERTERGKGGREQDGKRG